MAKIAKAPNGFYTAKEVMQKLEIGNSTLYHYVETKKIKKVIPPGKKEGYYPKADIDKMVRAKEIFILQYGTDSSIFEKAKEEDIRGIHEICASLWGNSTPRYEARLNSYRQNNDIYYVVKKEDITVGFLGIIPFREDILKEIMIAEQNDFYLRYQQILEMPDSILPFVPGKPVYSLSLDLQVRKGTPKEELYGMRLIQGCIETLGDLARRDIIVEKLHASSGAPHAIKLCRDAGFTELPPLPGSNRKRFELDLATTTSPFARDYQKVLKERKNQ
ncbi:MAG: helix-turn-helix domain-containing protein [Ktedonobacteraceae bacterium]|nr:helix-turn-helix domain-containing protein [Ktedonobacteraceae bacterium]